MRGAALLLFVVLTSFYRYLEDIRFVLAGAAIVCLVEVALALRARAHRQPASADRSRISATRVSYTEQDGAISVACVALLEGNDQRRLERALGRILRGVPFTSE